jgi:hypothetical protein
MPANFSNSDAILATLFDLLEAGGMVRAAGIVKSAQARFETTGYDNWSGGTNIYTLTAVRTITKQIQLVIVRGGFGTVGGLGNH